MAHYSLVDAFDDCINRLNAGQTIDDCLRAHPYHAEQLRPLLETAHQVRQARPTIPADTRARVRSRVLNSVPARPVRRRSGWLTSVALAAASLLVILFVGVMLGFFNRKPEEGIGASERLTLTAAIRPTTTATPTMTATPLSTATTAPTHTSTVTVTASATATTTPTLSPTSSATPTPTPSPTLTTSPTITPSPSPTPETSAAMAGACTFTVVPASINLRSGPGTGYSVIGYAFADEVLPVVRTHTSTLWVVVETPNGEAWVATSVGTLSGDCDTLPVSNETLLTDDGSGGSEVGDDGSAGGSGDDGSSPDSGEDGGGSDDHSGSGGGGEDSSGDDDHSGPGGGGDDGSGDDDHSDSGSDDGT